MTRDLAETYVLSYLLDAGMDATMEIEECRKVRLQAPDLVVLFAALVSVYERGEPFDYASVAAALPDDHRDLPLRVVASFGSYPDVHDSIARLVAEDRKIAPRR